MLSLGVYVFDQVVPQSSDKNSKPAEVSRLESENDTDKTPPLTLAEDKWSFSEIYKDKIQPLFQKILSNEEVEVAAQVDIKPDTQKESNETQTETQTEAEDTTLADMLTEDSPKKSETKEKKTQQETFSQTAKTKAAPAKVAQNTITAKAPKGWGIQVASFRSSKDAASVQKKIESSRYPNFIYQTQLNGETWYRVNIGPFDSSGAAAAFKRSRNIGSQFKGAFVKKL